MNNFLPSFYSSSHMLDLYFHLGVFFWVDLLPSGHMKLTIFFDTVGNKSMSTFIFLSVNLILFFFQSLLNLVFEYYLAISVMPYKLCHL